MLDNLERFAYILDSLDLVMSQKIGGGREGGKGRGLAWVMQFVMDEQKHKIKKRDIIFLQEIKTIGSLVVDKIDG